MKILLYVTIAIFCISLTDCCECIVDPGSQHLQTDLCGASISFIGKVIDAVPGQYTTVIVSKNIKGKYRTDQILHNISPGWVGTSCFPDFSKSDTHYLFTVSSEKFGVGACDVYRNLTLLTKEEKKYVGLTASNRRKYLNNCSCKIVSYQSQRSDDTCFIPIDANYTTRKCLYQHAICMSVRGRCQWIYNGC